MSAARGRDDRPNNGGKSNNVQKKYDVAGNAHDNGATGKAQTILVRTKTHDGGISHEPTAVSTEQHIDLALILGDIVDDEEQPAQ